MDLFQLLGNIDQRIPIQDIQPVRETLDQPRRPVADGWHVGHVLTVTGYDGVAE